MAGMVWPHEALRAKIGQPTPPVAAAENTQVFTQSA